MSGCPFAEYGAYGVFGGAFLFGLLLLKLVGGKRLSGAEVLFGAWNFLAFVCHMVFDAYFICHGRVTRKAANEPVPKADDYLGCYRHGVLTFWRQYADIDSRMYLDEFQPTILAGFYGAAIGGGILTLFAFLGHLGGCKSAHLWQIAAAVWHMGLTYTFVFPEHLAGYKHVSDKTQFWAVNGIFLVVPFLAMGASFCKILYGSCSTAACPIAPASTGDKKKKQ